MTESAARRVARMCPTRAEMEDYDASLIEECEALLEPPPDDDESLTSSMRPVGTEWRAYFDERGFVCPASLVELGDFYGEHFIECGTWRLNHPEHARLDHEMLLELSAEWPDAAPYADMIAVFHSDSDLVLIARDRQIQITALRAEG